MLKGNIGDHIVLVMMVFVLVITAFIANFLNDTFKEAFEGDVADTSSFDYSGHGVKVMDFGALLIVVVIIIAIIGSGWYLRTNPALSILLILTGTVIVLITVPFTNFFEDFIGIAEFEDTAEDFSIAVNVMRNLPIIITAGFLLLGIVLFAKRRME